MYAKGMTTKQIFESIEDIYGFETSESFISDVTDKILPQIEDWLNRQRSVFPGPQALLKSLYLEHSKPLISGQCQFATGEKCEANCQLRTRSACLNSRDHKIICSRHALLDKGMS